MLEYERDTFEEAHFLILERDGKILKDLHDDVPLAKQQLMDAIAQEEIGLGPRRTDPIRGEYSDIGFLGLYVGSGMAGTLNIPPGNIIHPDRIAGAAITRVHLSLFRIRFPLLAILTGALPFTRLFSLTRRSLVRTHRRRNNRCPGCGYDLRGSPERCPECGEQNSANSTPLHAS
ncbi:MAG TPA: zinc ribbon domain-containing protein [Tepidisphaeraceae bacterium]|nr:zinc ribbon domain-containing protein [Tepidisphaeraceae bacterium]